MKITENLQKKNINEDDIITDVERESSVLLDSVKVTQDKLSDFYPKLTEADDLNEYEDAVKKNLRSYKRASSNIIKAYKSLFGMSDELSARWEDLAKGKKVKHRKFIPSVPANSVIDLEENRSKHFAIGMNQYKIMLVCFIGSFAGVVIEMIWCLLNNGYIESRAGLVYGPFNLLYGFGAVALTLCLYRFRNKGKWLSFLGGMIVGSVVEYICSWLQETFFGSRSWDYSEMPFNINGRICLLYSVFWGILGVIWMKALYPWLAMLILKIPNRFGKTLTWILMAFIVVNAIITVIAVFRWSQRIDMIEPSNGFWEFIDSRFTNARMERIFANMKFDQ